MHLESAWYFIVDPIEELAELGRAVSAMHLTDDLATGDIERSEQGRGPMPPVVVGSSFGLTWSHRQNRLGAIQCLNLALLIGTQHQRPFGRIQIQANDIADFLDQLR